MKGLAMLVDNDQLEELLDSRANIRALEKELLKRRLALRETKTKLSAARDKIEDTLTEIEQRQGRLPFDEAEATEVVPPANGDMGDRRRPKGQRAQPRRGAQA
jgi:predicted  nucleic acid-binding Zn-ribbon protein